MRSLAQEERDLVYKCSEDLFAQTFVLMKQGKLSEKLTLELYPHEAAFLCSVLFLINRCDKKAQLNTK